jgi:alkaline phosphatase D
MQITRREFLRRIALGIPAAAAAPWLLSRAVFAATHGLDIASGDVTASQAMIWTRTAGPATVRVQYGTLPSLGTIDTAGPIEIDSGTGFTAKADLLNLRPATRYYYRVVGEQESRAVTSLVGTFKTAPPPEQASEVTFAWSADTSERNKPFRIFDTIRAKAPDFFLFLGDTVYADIDGNARTLDEYRASYVRNREDEPLGRFARSAPIYVIWDDHEVANNFDSTHDRIPIGRQALLEHWAIRPDRDDPHRLYRSFRWGRLVELFILDTRQYRSPEFDRDTAEKTMLGAAQKAWLKDALARSDAPFKVIVSSVPLKYHGVDTWEGYTTERQELVNFIAQNRIRRVVFLAADVHYAAVLRYPEGFVEAIAGPLAHSLIGRRRAAGEPETEFSFNSNFTFGMVRVTESALAIEIYDVEGRLLHRTTVNP